MNHLQEWSTVLAMALLHFVWQGCVVVALSAFVLRLLRRHSAQMRYAFACTALFFCLLLPLLYIWQNAPVTGELSQLTMVSMGLDASDGSAPQALTSVDGGTRSIWTLSRSIFAPYLPYFVMFWLAGVLLLIVRMILGLQWVKQQINQAAQHSDPIWQAKLEQLAQAMGIHKPLRFGLSSCLEFPVTAGWWRPIVILPASLLSGMPTELIEALLAHEVAHIKRFDYLVNLFQRLIEIVLFYHPAVWWLSAQIRQEREQIADDLAASLLGEPRRLALALSELEKFQFTHPQLAQVAHGGNLMLRIKRLIQPASTSHTAGWKIVLPGFALGVTCLALYAQAHGINTPTTPSALPTTSGTSTTVSTIVSSNLVSADLDKTAPVAIAKPTNKVDAKTDKEMNFALVRPQADHGTFVRTNRDSMAEINKLKRQHTEEFLWFSEKGQSYWIKDPVILSQAEALYQPVEELGVQMEQHGKKMEQYGKVMEKLGNEMATISVDEYAINRTVEASLQGLDKKLAVMEKKLEAAAAKVERAQSAQARQQALEQLSQQQAKFQELATKLQANDKLMQQHQTQIEQQLEQSLRPMQELSKKMEEAAKPMDELGKQMDQLGKKMEALSQQAEKQMLELIQTAKQKRLAQPVPPASGA